MAIGISFDKQQAEYLVECLSNGAPIEVIETPDAMLPLIGASTCVVAARMPHPPPRIPHRATGRSRAGDRRGGPREHAEAAGRFRRL